MVEKWKVFYCNGKELCAYTVKNTFGGEEDATRELLAYENGVSVSDITVVEEYR